MKSTLIKPWPLRHKVSISFFARLLKSLCLQPQVWKLSLGIIIGISLGHTAIAQYGTIIADDFRSVHPDQKDISVLTPWGATPIIQSCFRRTIKADTTGLTLPTLTLVDSALKYNGYTATNSLKTSSAVDYHFGPINRYQDTVLVQFDALWDEQITIGEGGRIVVALLHSVRTKPYVVGLLDSVQQSAPFGRPAYNFRMLNKRPSTNRGGLYLFYGGGQSSAGEVELYSNTTTGHRWWLPGFIAQPGGTAPGTGGNYPFGPTVTNFSPLANIKRWQRITMRVAPEMIEMWMRPTSDSSNSGYGSVIAQMAIPRVDLGITYVVNNMMATHNVNITAPPIMYNWFPTVNGVRLYYRAAQNAFIANFKVFATNHTLVGLDPTRNRQSSSLNLFPNPTSEYILANPDLDGQQASISNNLGQLVWRGVLSQNGVNVATWASGVYQLRTAAGLMANFVKQ